MAPGVHIRLTRNLDKERGFVNGATGIIDNVLDRERTIFTMVLEGTKNRILVHRITEGKVEFLPCTYGYATTIRRAQGSSLLLGALYFDLRGYPPERGYGYVGASRFKWADRIFHFGAIRRTDWLPVNMGREDPDEQTRRSAQSDSDDEFNPTPWALDWEKSEASENSDYYDDGQAWELDSGPAEVDEEERAAMFQQLAASAGPSELMAMDESSELIAYGGTSTPE